MPRDESRQVCAVCARVLSELTDRVTGQKTWIHPLDMELGGEEDHPPVPVMPNEITTDARCDFCFQPDPQWVLPVNDFPYDNLTALGLLASYGSAGSWAACDTCADFLNRGLWPNLTRRAMAAFRERHGTGEKDIDDFVDDQLRSMYRQLRKNVAGPVRRWEG